MNVRCRGLLRWYLGGVVLFCTTPPLAAQQPVPPAPPTRRTFLEDTHAFRFILHARGLQPLQTVEELNEDPQQTLLIVLGDTRSLATLPTPGLKAFIQNGGAILLATDRITPPLIGELFGARVTGEMLIGGPPAESYRRLPECPLIWNGHPFLLVFRDIGSERKSVIATNRPSVIESVARPQNALNLAGTDAAWYGLRLPQGFPVFARVFYPNQNDPNGGQRMVMLADHSLFINSMMLQDDNGNFAFAQNLVSWLSKDGQRKKVLFLDDGKVQQKFEVSIKDIPDPTKLPPQRLPVPPVEVLNQVLASWQDDDIFNRLILERFSMNQVLSGLALWLGVVFLAYGFFRLWRGRYLQDVHP